MATGTFRNIERPLPSAVYLQVIPPVPIQGSHRWPLLNEMGQKKCYEFRIGLVKRRRGCPGQPISFLRGSFPNSFGKTKHIPRELQRNRNARTFSGHTDAALYRNNLTRMEQITKWNK